MFDKKLVWYKKLFKKRNEWSNSKKRWISFYLINIYYYFFDYYLKFGLVSK